MSSRVHARRFGAAPGAERSSRPGIRVGLIAVLLTAILGCAHAYRYEPEPNAPTAQVQLRVEALLQARRSPALPAPVVTTQLFDYERGCPSAPIEMLGFGRRQYLGQVRTGPAKPEASVTIPAGHFVAVQLQLLSRGLLASHSCEVGFGFVAETGQTYTMTLRLGTGRCGVELSDGKDEPVPTVTHRGCPALLESIDDRAI